MVNRKIPPRVVNWYVKSGSHDGYHYYLPKRYGGLPIDDHYALFNGSLNQLRVYCKDLIEESHESYHKNNDMYADVFYSPLDWCNIAKGMIVSKEDVRFLESCGEEIDYATVGLEYGRFVEIQPILIDRSARGIVSLQRWEDGKYEVRWRSNRSNKSYRIARNGSLLP